MRELVRAWRYDPDASKRDLRLDLLRGLCLLKMVTNHIGPSASLTIQKLIGYATAAEGFFFISGAVVGIVHGRRMIEHGLGTASRQVLRRAVQLYVANLAFVMLFLALERVGAIPYSALTDAIQIGVQWPELFAFNLPYYLHVLPRYVFFLALTPAALWCLGRGRTLWLLGACSAVYIIRLRIGADLSIGFLERPEPSSFPLLSWQLLFFVGMCLGYHRNRLASLWSHHSRSVIPGLVLLYLGFLVLRHLGETGSLPLLGKWSHLLLGREHLGPLRLVNLLAVFGTCFVLVDRLWSPLRRLVGAVLLPFGQHSLYLFLMHIPVAWLSRPIFTDIIGHSTSTWQLLGLELALVALLWLMIRRRMLFGLVPT